MTPDEFADFNAEKFSEFVREKVALKKLFPKKFTEVQKKIIDFYINNPAEAHLKKDNVFYLKKYAQVWF